MSGFLFGVLKMYNELLVKDYRKEAVRDYAVVVESWLINNNFKLGDLSSVIWC